MKILYRIREAELRCPRCGRFHVDREEWANRPHHTHECERCDHLWLVGEGSIYYVGIPPKSITGRARALVHKAEDVLSLLLAYVTG